MSLAKSPKPDELIADRFRTAGKRPGWIPPSMFRPGTWCYTGPGEEPDGSGPSRIPGPGSRPTTTGNCPPNWKEIILNGYEGTPGKIPVLPPLHGHLRPLRRLRRQVPLLHRLRRPEEHAGPAGRAAAFRLPPLFHESGKRFGRLGRGPRPDRSTSSRSGSTTSTSAPNAAAVRSSAPTASTRRRSP